MKENLDDECKLLLENQEKGCLQFKNAHKVKSHPSIQKGGCNEVHDIEDLVKVGQVVTGCSYFASRSMAEDAQIVFCPYNYIVNPVIRRAMNVDIKGAILILDEAHNIEDTVREAGSVDVEDIILEKLKGELEQLCANDPMLYQPLYEMAEGLLSWLEQRKGTLGQRDSQHFFSCWSGDKALKELLEANITQQNFPILLECATKVIKAATDTEPDVVHLSGMSVNILEGLISSLAYFFSRNGSHTCDYQLALQRYIKRDKHNSSGEWVVMISLWCMNPAVVFSDIAELSLSVILTSGTLSPMNSFSSELGVHFGTCLDAPHVVDIPSQVLVSVLTTGSDNYPLNASYKTADSHEFQDSLGLSLEEICKVVPAGSLVFFPSYKLMEKMCHRWKRTGQWSRINARKPIFTEPRGGSQEELDSVLKDYYKSICHTSKPHPGRKRRVKKAAMVQPTTAENCENFEGRGAAFLAVCRGKVSEGIDFSDDYARVVIIIGIPFPNINDIQVTLKKKYNDTYKTSKNLLSGDEWYCHQAFRALNQAAGRCIRHRFDYGAIILLDERYNKERNRMYISKWLRTSIQLHDRFDVALQGLKSFFRDAKEKVNIAKMNLSKSDCPPRNSPLNTENLLSKILHSFGRASDETPSKEPHTTYPESGSEITDLSPRVVRDASPDDVMLTIVNETPTHAAVSFSNSSKEHAWADATPEKVFATDSSLNQVDNSPFSLSVNARSQRKRRVIADDAFSGEEASGCFNFSGSPIPHNERCSADLRPPCSPHVAVGGSLLASCAACKSPLGLPENALQIKCARTSSSKAYLLSLAKELERTHTDSGTVAVLLAEKWSLSKRVFPSTHENPVWNENDGCVFASIFCPFCRTRVIGVEILATDASNTHLLNKVMLLVDCLEIGSLPSPACETPKNAANRVADSSRIAALSSIDKFSYSPKATSGGWRTTRSKVSYS